MKKNGNNDESEGYKLFGQVQKRMCYIGEVEGNILKIVNAALKKLKLRIGN